MQQACHLIAREHYMERPQQKLGHDAYECIQKDSKHRPKLYTTVT